MASRGAPARGLLSSALRGSHGARVSLTTRVATRCFRAGPPRLTDGVFRGLTDTRLPMPWIEAFRLQQEGQSLGFEEAHHRNRDLTPKKMSDSYHRVVSALTQIAIRAPRDVTDGGTGTPSGTGPLAL